MLDANHLTFQQDLNFNLQEVFKNINVIGRGAGERQ